MPSSLLILCHPLLLLPPIPPSIRVFSNESTFRMRWPKYWSFSFSIIPSKEIPGLISFRMDWLDLLAVQGTLKSLVFSNTTVQKHQFFGVQLSSQSNSHNAYMTTGKTIAFSRQTFVGKVMSLLFNMLAALSGLLLRIGISPPYSTAHQRAWPNKYLLKEWVNQGTNVRLSWIRASKKIKPLVDKQAILFNKTF